MRRSKYLTIEGLIVLIAMLFLYVFVMFNDYDIQYFTSFFIMYDETSTYNTLMSITGQPTIGGLTKVNYSPTLWLQVCAICWTFSVIQNSNLIF